MAKNTKVTAQRWFSLGQRVPYDLRAKRIISPGEKTDSTEVLQVFRRVARSDAPGGAVTWTTFLPGFPDGSFGWARVEKELAGEELGPKLFVEYVGQGESDKPAAYPYGTVERADLVEALWEEQGVESTVLVTFDYSSLVALELLNRQQESAASPRIVDVLIINGGLFADAHSHPWFTTPLLKTPMGKMGTWAAQRSKLVFNQLVKVLYSKEYNVTSEELGELYDAIARRNGVAFLSNAAGFVDEHRQNANRWDLGRIVRASSGDVSFHVVGSEDDIFEPKQIEKARERLGDQDLDIQVLPGGHMTTSEHPQLLAKMITDLRLGT